MVGNHLLRVLVGQDYQWLVTPLLQGLHQQGDLAVLEPPALVVLATVRDVRRVHGHGERPRAPREEPSQGPQRWREVPRQALVQGLPHHRRLPCREADASQGPTRREARAACAVDARPAGAHHASPPLAAAARSSVRSVRTTTGAAGAGAGAGEAS